jgi:hypothetical protein
MSRRRQEARRRRGAVRPAAATRVRCGKFRSRWPTNSNCRDPRPRCGRGDPLAPVGSCGTARVAIGLTLAIGMVLMVLAMTLHPW